MTLPPTTLALGGGGARGVAHFGAIEVLVEAGVRIERVVGVSIGSLVAAMYAFDPDIGRVQQKALGYLMSPDFQRHQQTLFGAHPKPGEETTGGLFTWYDRVKVYLHANRLFRRVVRSPSLMPGIILHDVVNHLLPDADIADATIPLSIVAVDLRSGEQIVLDKGPLREAVRASSSLPAIFPPVEMGGMSLCDIGVFCSVPVTVARSFSPKCLVAIDVSSGTKRLTRCETALDVLIRMDEIAEALFRKHIIEDVDVLIRPDVAGEWFDFSICVPLIDAGRMAARKALAEYRHRRTLGPQVRRWLDCQRRCWTGR